MELMIAYPLILPDQPLSLDDLEGAIQAWGQEIKQRALALAWEAQAGQRPVVPCPTCQSCAHQRAGRKARTVETVFGAVRLAR